MSEDDTVDSPAVLLFHLPSQSLCGIDLLSFTTTPQFSGLKHLPPGWHFVFCSPTHSLSVRHGTWFRVSNPFEDGLIEAAIGSAATGGGGWRPDIFVLNWDFEKEELIPEVDETAVLRARGNLGSLWKKSLAPYRQSSSASRASEQVGGADTEEEDNHWEQLIDCIDSDLLDRITSQKHRKRKRGQGHQYFSLSSISSSEQDVDELSGIEVKARSDENQLPGDVPDSHELNFFKIDLKRTWRPGAIGRERTDAAQDRTWSLNNIIHSQCPANDLAIVGEIQFTFIMVLTLNNWSCFEQWRRLVSLCLTCTNAIRERARLFIKLFRTLRLQIERCGNEDGGMFDLQGDTGTLLHDLLLKFRKNVESLEGTVEKQDVIDEVDEVEQLLSSSHGFDFHTNILRRGMVNLEDGERVELDMNDADEAAEEGDYAPQIVSLTEEQFAKLGGEGAVMNQNEINDLLRKSKLQNDMAHTIEASEGDDDTDDEIDERILSGTATESNDLYEDETEEADEMDLRF